MKQDEIIEMARQAGFLTNENKSYVISPYTFEDQDLYEELEVFAKLVAAKEREACAKVCEELELKATKQPPMVGQGCQACISAIRARGEA